MPHHQDHAQITQHAAQSGLPIPIHHPISVSWTPRYCHFSSSDYSNNVDILSLFTQQLFSIDPHTQQTIKTENDNKFYHFPSHSMGKPQILSDTKLPPAQMFDVRNADGQIVHVNIEDINQFLTYHEVFGKIGNTDHTFPPTSNSLSIPPINASVPVSNAQSTPIVPASINNQTNSQSQTTPLIIPKIENINTSGSNTNSISVSTTSNVTNTTTATCVTAGANDDSTTMPSPGMHTCDICGKVFAFKYQFIGKKMWKIHF